MKKVIILLMLILILSSSDIFARRGGGGSGFFGRSSLGSSGGFTGGGTSVSIPVFIYIGSGGGFIVFLVFGMIALSILRNVVKKKTKSSLANIQLGFYLRDGKLLNQIKELIKGMNPNDVNSCYIALREISVIILRAKEQIRWYNFDITNFSNDQELESGFSKIGEEERTKYDEEEVINVKDVKKETSDIKENLEEVFILTIVIAVFTKLESKEKTFENTLEVLKTVSSISSDNFAGVSIWYNIMDKDEIIETYPEIKVV